MNRAELVDSIAKQTGFSKKDAEKALAAVIDAVTAELKSGGKVQLVGFGSFEVKARPARTGRNPANNQPIQIAASKTPVFKAGKAFKDSIA